MQKTIIQGEDFWVLTLRMHPIFFLISENLLESGSNCPASGISRNTLTIRRKKKKKVAIFESQKNIVVSG